MEKNCNIKLNLETNIREKIKRRWEILDQSSEVNKYANEKADNEISYIKIPEKPISIFDNFLGFFLMYVPFLNLFMMYYELVIIPNKIRERDEIIKEYNNKRHKAYSKYCDEFYNKNY